MTLSIIFWTMYFSDLAQSCIDKSEVSLWVLSMLLLLQIGFFCERNSMLSLSDNNQADIVLASNSSYLDELINIDNPYFKQKVS